MLKNIIGGAEDVSNLEPMDSEDNYPVNFKPNLM